MTAAVWALILTSVSLNALAQVALRKTMLGIGSMPQRLVDAGSFLVNLVVSPWFAGGLFCYAASLGLWLIVLGKVEVSLAYPMLSIGYLITAFVGYVWLQEHVDLNRIVGIGLIGVGIVVLSRSA